MKVQRARPAFILEKQVRLITLWRQAVDARQLVSQAPRALGSRTGMRASRRIIVQTKWLAILARLTASIVARQGRVAARARLARRRTSVWPAPTDIAFASQVLMTAAQVT